LGQIRESGQGGTEWKAQRGRERRKMKEGVQQSRERERERERENRAGGKKKTSPSASLRSKSGFAYDFFSNNIFTVRFQPVLRGTC